MPPPAKPRPLPQGLLLWLALPLLTGIGGYLCPTANPASTSSPKTTTHPSATVKLRSDPSKAMQEALDARNETASQGPPAGLDPEKIRTLLLGLQAEITLLTSPTEQSRRCAISERMDELAAKLAIDQGTTGVDWLRENLPDLKNDAIRDWSRSNPDAAFEYLANCRTFNPCDPPSALDLVAAHIRNGKPDELLSAIRSVPWHLFLTGDSDSRQSSFYLASNHPPEPWLESGALQYLTEQGIAVSEIFRDIAKNHPDQAVSAWTGWPQKNPTDADRFLGEMHNNFYDSAPVDGPLACAFESASPAVHEQLASSVARLRSSNARVRILSQPCFDQWLQVATGNRPPDPDDK